MRRKVPKHSLVGGAIRLLLVLESLLELVYFFNQVLHPLYKLHFNLSLTLVLLLHIGNEGVYGLFLIFDFTLVLLYF